MLERIVTKPIDAIIRYGARKQARSALAISSYTLQKGVVFSLDFSTLKISKSPKSTLHSALIYLTERTTPHTSKELSHFFQTLFRREIKQISTLRTKQSEKGKHLLFLALLFDLARTEKLPVLLKKMSDEVFQFYFEELAYAVKTPLYKKRLDPLLYMAYKVIAQDLTTHCQQDFYPPNKQDSLVDQKWGDLDLTTAELLLLCQILMCRKEISLAPDFLKSSVSYLEELQHYINSKNRVLLFHLPQTVSILSGSDDFAYFRPTLALLFRDCKMRREDIDWNAALLFFSSRELPVIKTINKIFSPTIYKTNAGDLIMNNGEIFSILSSSTENRSHIFSLILENRLGPLLVPSPSVRGTEIRVQDQFEHNAFFNKLRLTHSEIKEIGQNFEAEVTATSIIREHKMEISRHLTLAKNGLKAVVTDRFEGIRKLNQISLVYHFDRRYEIHEKGEAYEISLGEGKVEYLVKLLSPFQVVRRIVKNSEGGMQIELFFQAINTTHFLVSCEIDII